MREIKRIQTMYILIWIRTRTYIAHISSNSLEVTTETKICTLRRNYFKQKRFSVNNASYHWPLAFVRAHRIYKCDKFTLQQILIYIVLEILLHYKNNKCLKHRRIKTMNKIDDQRTIARTIVIDVAKYSLNRDRYDL